jgi:hypothetical protein
LRIFGDFSLSTPLKTLTKNEPEEKGRGVGTKKKQKTKSETEFLSLTALMASHSLIEKHSLERYVHTS